MKKVSLLIATIFTVAAANAQSEIITLDLTKATTPMEFNENNGAWTGTYDDDAESIDSQVFVFVHGSMADWNTWWGFTASNHADNTRPENTLIQQWSNMAKGGIVLNDDGTIMTDKFGVPVTSANVPYIVGFYSPFMNARPLDMTFADSKTYDAVGVYINLNSYAYYSMEYGDAFARAFTNGDKFTLTIHGVADDESEKTVEVNLAEYSNGDLTINRGWKYVDLTPLGTVNELYFTLDCTDSGDYGMNTPAYFCLDKLMVKATDDSAITSPSANSAINILYDRESHIVRLTNSDFAIIYDSTGSKVMTADCTEFSVDDLTAGIYIIKSGNRTLKIAK